MRLLSCHAFGLLLLVSLACASTSRAEGEADAVDVWRRTPVGRGCGVFSVALWLRRQESQVTRYHDLAKVVDPDDDGISSMAEVRAGLHAFGVHARAVRFPDCVMPDVPCIVRLSRGPFGLDSPHFAYLEPIGDGQALVFYAPLRVFQWTIEDLGNSWSGEAVCGPPAEGASGGKPPLRVLGGVIVLLGGLALLLSRRVGVRRGDQP